MTNRELMNTEEELIIEKQKNKVYVTMLLRILFIAFIILVFSFFEQLYRTPGLTKVFKSVSLGLGIWLLIAIMFDTKKLNKIKGEWGTHE